MARTTIYRKREKKFYQFFRDGDRIGTSRYTGGFLMDEILVYQNDMPKYALKEINRFVWFLRNGLLLISLFISLFLNGRYAVFEDGAEIGYARETWIRPISSFMIRNNLYQVFVHKGNCFSLTKNGTQIALYTKRPEETLKCQPNAYDIDYEKNVQIEIIELFCLFIDTFFFTPYNGTSKVKVVVPHDPYPNHTLWRPKE